jgi:hypothetical protein
MLPCVHVFVDNIIDIDTYDNKTYCFLQGLVVSMKKKSTAVAVLVPTIRASGVAPAIVRQQSTPSLKRKRKITRNSDRLLSLKASTPRERTELLAKLNSTPW